MASSSKKATTKQTRGTGGTKTGQRKRRTAGKAQPGAARVLVPIFLAAAGIFVFVMQLNAAWTGVVGTFLHDMFLGLFGCGFYLFVPLLILGACFFGRDLEHHAVGLKILFAFGLLLFFSAWTHVIVLGEQDLGDLTVQQMYRESVVHPAGGAVGGILASLLLKCGVAGAWIISIVFVLLCSMFYCGTTPVKLIGDLRYLLMRNREARERLAEQTEEQDRENRAARVQEIQQMQAEHLRRKQQRREQRRLEKEERRRGNIDHNIYSDDVGQAEKTQTDDDVGKNDESSQPGRAQKDEEQTVAEQTAPSEVQKEEISPEPLAPTGQSQGWDLNDILGKPHTGAGTDKKEDGKNNPNGISTQKQDDRLQVNVSDIHAPYTGGTTQNETNAACKNEPAQDYVFPPMSILHQEPEQMNLDATVEMQENAEKLVKTLQSFRVNTKIIHVSRGPTITRYELAPQAGTRVRAIANLVDDIALSLATTGVRIEAPVPGKAAVGIEVPNKTRETVYIRDLMERDEFRLAKSKINTCLGMDVAGEPVYLDIAKMPHLLIAGATGMGKSVCINSLIVSMLYKATPEEVKLILIDPKKVELNIYNGIPHLLVPVVSDPKKAAGSLHWAVGEMERRFEQIEDVGVRDIAAYNKITRDDPEKPPMSQIVIIIDELADLMMTAPDEVEESICRLAQKARAAGMHLIIGTQRPSVDVITGLIKANIPSRIAFTVASQVDSRTILDIAGAEKLIGRGDMLYAPVGLTKPLRVQGSFVSEKEIAKITRFLKKNAGEIEYDQNVLELINRAAEMCGNAKNHKGIDGAETAEISGDPKMKEAIDLAVQNGTISTSLLQRKLSLGYGRAAKIIDAMQEKGFVSPPEGQKPRTVLITRAQWEQLQMGGSAEVTDHLENAADRTQENDVSNEQESSTSAVPGAQEDPAQEDDLPWEN